jgi:hypothetical protein
MIESPSLSAPEFWRLAEVIAVTLVLSGVTFFITRRNTFVGLTFLVLPLLITGGILQELHDPATGAGISIAHGVTYFRAVYGAAVIISVGSILAAIAGIRLHRRTAEA